MAVEVELEDVMRGDLIRFKFTFTDGGGNALDITDWLIWWTVKDDVAKADVDAKLQVMHTAGAGPQDDATNGVAYLVATKDDTNGAEAGKWGYDFQYVIPLTTPLEVKTINYGKVKFVTGYTLAEAAP